MRVFLAGATGVVGRRLLPRLVAAGHQVTAMTRHAERAAALAAAGAEPVVADAYDAARLAEAVRAARPEAVVHQLTDIPRALDPRRYAEQMAGNDRLRVEGTRNLVAAAVAAGARRLIAQSIAFAYAPGGNGPAGEDEPLFDDAPAPFGRSVAALRALEKAVTATPGLEGVVLRYGMFYGPDTAHARDGHFAEQVRRRHVPLVGRGAGVVSFVHVDDAASAVPLALERGAPGVYNIVDDEPAAFADWLPVYAAALGAKPPHRVPELVARVAAGPLVVVLATRARGASNAKARRELGFVPRYPSWRQGFRDGLGGGGGPGSG